MGFRFRKSIKAGPVRVNLSKSGIGYSVGGKGYRYTKKAGGGTRTTTSIPGTGIAYTKDTGSKKKNTQVTSSAPTKTNARTPQQTTKNKSPWQSITGLILLIVGIVFFDSNPLLALIAFITSLVFICIGIKKTKKNTSSQAHCTADIPDSHYVSESDT